MLINRENYLILLFCLSFMPSIYGQTIIADVNRLVEAKQIIEHQNSDTADSTLIQAASDILVVLNLYRNPINHGKEIFKDWSDLKNIYYDNPLLNNLTKNKKLQLSRRLWKRAHILAKNNMRIIEKEPRALALKFLNAETAISPADEFPHSVFKMQRLTKR